MDAAWSPMAAGREAVRFWDMESRQQVCTLPIEPSHFRFLQFSDDGRRLALSTPSGQVRIITLELPRYTGTMRLRNG